MSSRASELERSTASGDADRDGRDLEAELASPAAGRFGIPVDASCVGCGRTHVKRATLEEMDQPPQADPAALERDDLTLEQRREIAETLSTRAVTFDVETEIAVTTD